MKEKNFENYLEKNNNLSKSTLTLRIYGYQLINKFVNLESKIIEFKKLDDPDEEMEELLQEWINHIVKNPPTKKNLTSVVLKQYANAVNTYLKYHRFRIDIKTLKFPKQLYEEKYPITVEEIQQILNVAKWIKQAYYLCLISTGARPREILGLTKNDVEWVGDKYKALIPAKLTKKGMSRTVFFSKECNPSLNQIMKEDRIDLFPHNKDLHKAISNEGNVFREYCDRIGFNQKHETTGNYKINLYSFRRFFFTKALDHFKDDIAHAMTGHGAYLQVYQSRTEQQKKELWDELEPEILIFDQSKKEQKIRDLEIALKQNKNLEERVEEQGKQIKELFDYAFKKIE
jgi:integrase